MGKYYEGFVVCWGYMWRRYCGVIYGFCVLFFYLFTSFSLFFTSVGAYPGCGCWECWLPDAFRDRCRGFDIRLMGHVEVTAAVE